MAKKSSDEYYTNAVLPVYNKELPVYAELYKSRTAGLREAVNSWLPLRIYCLREIKGLFTAAEITAMTDYLRYIRMPDPYTLCNNQILLGLIIDSEDHMNFENKYGIDYRELTWKIQQLTAAQTYFLRSEINRYWGKHKGFRQKMDEFVQIFL